MNQPRTVILTKPDGTELPPFHRPEHFIDFFCPACNIQLLRTIPGAKCRYCGAQVERIIDGKL
jgi:hypothetical protein